MELIKDTTIKIKTKAGISITIPVYNKVNIITGDSATGKTKMVKYLDIITKDKTEIVETSINIENLIICNNKHAVIEKIKENIENKIFIIDRFDTMSEDEEIISFLNESSNIFIICAHKTIAQCGYSIDSLLGLKHDKINYEAYKLYKNAADYMINRTVQI